MSVPMLRFPEFSGEWEEKKVLDIADTIDGDRSNRYPNEKDIVKEGIIFLSTSNIINNKLDFKEKRFITKQKYDELSKGQLDQDDLIVTLRGSIGNIVLFSSEIFDTGFINAQMMIIRLHENCISFFYNWYLNPKTKREILKISSGSAQPQLTKSDIKNLKINLPKIKEQEKIASFLSKVDEKIEKLEKKQELWETYKKGIMQQIFSQELRFKDENGEYYPDWEEKRLIELVERVARKNKELESNLPLTISAEHGLVDQETFFNKIVASKSLKGYYLIRNGEFAYNKSYSNGFPWGVIKRLDKYDKGALSTLYICFSLKDGINSDFVVQYFLSDLWHKEVSLIAVEGARNHGLLNIGIQDFFNTKHTIPSLSEQEKIAKILNNIDNKLENLKKELEYNKEFKKGLLQQMFC